MFKAQWKVDHASVVSGLGLLMSRVLFVEPGGASTRIVATAFRVFGHRDGTRSRDSRRAESSTDAPGNSAFVGLEHVIAEGVRLGHREVGLDHPVELSTYDIPDRLDNSEMDHKCSVAVFIWQLCLRIVAADVKKRACVWSSRSS